MRNKLEFKILFTIICIIIVSIFVSSIGVLYVERSDIYAVARDRLKGTAGVITTGIEQTMISDDTNITRNFVSGLKIAEVSIRSVHDDPIPGVKIDI